MITGNDPASMILATMLKQYLDEVGIRIELDVADPGRFNATIYSSSPGPDLALMFSGMDVNYLVTYMRWFSTSPFFDCSYLGHTEEQKALDEEAKHIPDAAGQRAMTKKLIRYLTDNAMMIPILWYQAYVVVTPYVHTAPVIGPTWHTEDVWMEPN